MFVLTATPDAGQTPPPTVFTQNPQPCSGNRGTRARGEVSPAITGQRTSKERGAKQRSGRQSPSVGGSARLRHAALLSWGPHSTRTPPGGPREGRGPRSSREKHFPSPQENPQGGNIRLPATQTSPAHVCRGKRVRDQIYCDRDSTVFLTNMDSNLKGS